MQIKRMCRWCGKIFECDASRLKHGRGKHCSPACQYATRRAQPHKASIELICLNCGKRFSRCRSWLRRIGGGKYCCRKCRDQHRVGNNHPDFVNGNSAKQYGPNWQSQRRKARKQNSTCQHCGINSKECKKRFGVPLNVHHIKPFRLCSGYKEANHLDNLTILCSACHRRADAKTRGT